MSRLFSLSIIFHASHTFILNPSWTLLAFWCYMIKKFKTNSIIVKTHPITSSLKLKEIKMVKLQ